MMPRLFLDLDGVLADFDSGYEKLAGRRPDRDADNADWRLIASRPDFYLNLPPTPDFVELWTYVAPRRPTILTGIPSSIAQAAEQKRAWVARFCGPSVSVITTESKNKYRHASPGDILVDDWEKHRRAWLDAGGVWVTHRSAAETITSLQRLFA